MCNTISTMLHLQYRCAEICTVVCITIIALAFLHTNYAHAFLQFCIFIIAAL